MIEFILAIIFAVLALFGISLRKTYNYVPVKELKRQAQHGDPLAKVLYRAVAYGASLQLFLWLFIGVTAALSMILFTSVAPSWLAFLAIVGLLWYGFAWLPEGHLTSFGARVVMKVTPAIEWLLNYLHPLFDRLIRFVRRHRPVTFHTGLYEREDLLHLLEEQRAQPDSRIPHEELDILLHAVTFGDKVVSDILVPRRIVKMVSENETIGPVLINELHESGHSRFPVYKDKQDEVTGTLFLRDLLNVKQGGKVASHMHSKVVYVHEDHSLYQVLHAFLTTKHHLFIVVNSFEEYVGIVTIEDVLEQIIGHKIVDEFDNYDDLRAVAQHLAQAEHTKHKQENREVAEPEKVPQSDETVVE